VASFSLKDDCSQPDIKGILDVGPALAETRLNVTDGWESNDRVIVLKHGLQQKEEAERGRRKNEFQQDRSPE
jgi:hypothetical protein